MAIRAVVFDFDGLILQTEETSLAGWRHVFELHGQELDVAIWMQNLGTSRVVDLHRQLETLVGRELDRAALDRTRMDFRDVLHQAMEALPGVVDHLTEAKSLGLGTAIASSSPDDWVAGHLDRLGLVDAFAHVACYDGVSCRPKPAPDLYLAALDALDVAPHEAIAYEDSHNGVAAAKAAGLSCVAVPHDLTRHMDLSAADVVVDSLSDVTLTELIARFG